MSIRLLLVAGARPNFMKIAPLMAAFAEDKDFESILVHTGQHYDDSMSGSFFRDLKIPAPQHHLEVGSGSHAQQTAEIMRRLEPVVLTEKPDGVLVVGDVNSTLAGALVASKLEIPVIHAEAGLRSFDRSMPEEINRLLTDAVSDLMLVTEESGRENLLREGRPSEQIVLVGNFMVDSLRRHLQDALQSNVRERLGIGVGPFGLITLHRPANVDSPATLEGILGALSAISEEIPLIWPLHPRTRARIAGITNAASSRIIIVDPLSYLDFLNLQSKAAVILTDSGGIQEESTVLGVKCLTLRDNTERPATILYGTNRLAGTSRESILRTWREVRDAPLSATIPPLWDGKAGIRSHEAIQHFYSLRRARNN